jgi:hypothetical protein
LPGWIGQVACFHHRPARTVTATQLAVTRRAVLLPGDDGHVFQAGYRGGARVGRIDLHLAGAGVVGVVVIGGTPFAHVGGALVTGDGK